MGAPSTFERHLPLRKHDLIEACVLDPRLPVGEREGFRGFCRILQSVLHHEFHSELERLKDCHAPFDPDADTLPLGPPLEAAELRDRQRRLTEGFTKLLVAANYEPVVRSVLTGALQGESLFKVRLEIDFDDFEELVVYWRGRSERSATVSAWAGLRKRAITFTNYSRVALLMRLRDAEHFRRRKHVNPRLVPGSTIIKLFRNVPAADLEMLFPNTEVRMKAFDKVLLGVPAAVGGVLVLATKLLSTLLLTGSLLAFWLGLSSKRVELDESALMGLGVGLFTLAAFVFKQIGRFRSRKIRFLQTLAEDLYFKSLDNNAGVFHHLLDEAEEEECKEAILAYWFLLCEAEPLRPEQLDRGAEAWLLRKLGRPVDFEAADAIAKLERLGLVARKGERLRALPLQEGTSVLQRTWGGFFARGA